MTLAYDGAGSRITKKRERKVSGGEWTTELATHYTGIGSEIREDALNNATKVVVNLPQGLGRYDIASASESSANTVPSFEWYLKNHLGSTMLVYGINGNNGSLKAAYDYRAFGEQVDLTWPTNKVTETFTGKELDDETELSYFGARYLDQMLGMWVSVDAKRQFNSPYLYAGNGANPVNGVDEDGNVFVDDAGKALYQKAVNNNFWGNKDIENAYKYANETQTKIRVNSQNGLIKQEYAGLTVLGTKDQILVMKGEADPNHQLGEASVILSKEGNQIWSDALNITIDEAEARIATHEFEAHIRNFTPYSKNGVDPVDLEHNAIEDIDQRLDTPRSQCKDE
ncbi:MAG: hypothetical protein GX638_07320 [Crenarchaeota archaeon]|nr:hypothetical protein [Thermoproteota archaeon]